MRHEDHEAAKLKHAEEIGFLMFPAADESAEIMEPSEEAFDFPAAAVAPQFPAVLGALAAAIVLVRRDQPDMVFLPKALVERIAVVGPVADQSCREFVEKASGQGFLDEFCFVRRGTIDGDGKRKTGNSGDGHYFRPLATLGRPHGQAPFFALAKVPSSKPSSSGSSP